MTAELETTVPHGRADERAPIARVGRFVVLDRLGQGGMGVVYAAYDPELDRKVAIKLLRDTSADAEARSRMQREARAMARLSDPHVVAVYDVGMHDDQIFIAMELVQGRTLRQWLSVPRSWREVIAIFAQAGKGLAAAHGAGIVHRDFKPENVLIGSDDRVRVTDFGLARANVSIASGEFPAVGRAPTRADAATLTEHGTLVGTPAYMSPEQIMGRAADASSDQFSYCVALWEALYGERPFVGDNVVELAIAIGEAALPPAPDGSVVPAWLRVILTRGLSREPLERYSNMSQLLAMLQTDPSARRRRIFAVATALGLAATGVAGWRVRVAQRTEECSVDSRGLRDAWRSDYAALTAAASDAPHAFGILERVAPRLDDYATQWSELREQTCLAARVDGTASRETYERAVECLEDRGTTFRAFTHSLVSGDRDVFVNAIVGAAKLPALAVCVDERWLARQAPPPDAATNTSVQEIRGRLRVAQAHELAHRWAGGLEIARAAADDAARLDWQPLLAEARYRVGMLQSELDPQAARAEIEEAWFDAGQSGHDELATEAALQLAAMSSRQSPHEIEAAMVWVRVAEVFAGRSDADVITTADILAMKGKVAIGGPSPSAAAAREAVDQLRTALDLRRRAAGDDDPGVADLHRALGNAFAAAGNWNGAFDEHQTALMLAERVLGPDHPMLCKHLNDLAIDHLDRFSGRSYIARTADQPLKVLLLYFAQQDRKAALRAYERAMKILDTTGEQGSEMSANIRVGLGDAHGVAGEWIEAYHAFAAARTIFDRLRGGGHPMVATAEYKMAHALQSLGFYPAADDLYGQAMSKESASPIDVAETLLQRGEIAFVQGFFESALAHYQGARGSAEEAVMQGAIRPLDPRRFQSISGVGRSLVALGRFDEALSVLGRAHAIGALCFYTLAPEWRAMSDDLLAAALLRSAHGKARAARAADPPRR